MALWQRAVSTMGVSTLLLTACQHRPPATADKTPTVARIPRDAARFSIDSTSDTTVVFRGLEADWLRTGMRGHAVDPLQHDALIARLTIMSVDTNRVVAVITGKVSQVSTTNVVLLVRPQKSWQRDHRFWFGAIGGVVVGAIVGSAVH